MRLKREFKIGVLFLVGLFLLIVFSLVISKIRIFSQDYYLRVIFESGGGLKEGDPVQVSGFEMGSVKSIKLRSDTTVRVKLKLYQKIELYEDYSITIREASLLGGNYVDILLGTSGKAVISEKTTLHGQVGLPGLAQLGQLIEENEQNIKDSLSNINKFFDEGQQLVKDAKKIVDKINKGEGNVGQFINDDGLYINLKESSESLKKIVQKIESGKGPLGKLVFDEELADQISRAGDSVVKVFEPAAKTKVFAGVESKYYFESRLSISRPYIVIYPRETRYFLIGASAFSFNHKGKVDYEDKVVKNQDQLFWKLDLQLAYSYSLGEDSLFTFRTGLLEGKLGAGLDFDLPATITGWVPITFTLEGRDAYDSVIDEDIDEDLVGSLFRAYATAKLGKHFRIYCGASRLFSGDVEWMAGICFQYLDEDIKNFIALVGLSQ